MAADYDEWIDLRDDGRLRLCKRVPAKAPTRPTVRPWWVRVRIPGATGYQFKSTKLTNRGEAEHFARNLYEQLYFEVQAGGTLKSKTFKQVFDEWKKHAETIGHSRKGGSMDDTINRVESYALTYFGAMKIKAIGTPEFQDFWAWRKVNFTRKSPLNGTLNRENKAIMAVFKFAVDRGYIAQTPKSNPPKATLERRPAFTEQEWKTIYTKAREWVEAGKPLGKWRARFMTQHWILVLANSGLRPGEVNALRWSNLRTIEGVNGSQAVGEVRGKTLTREAVFQPGSDTYLKRVYDQRVKELGHAPSSNEVVFCHTDGSPVRSRKNSFNSLMKFAGITMVRSDGRRAPYSLRHFYATMRLSNETNPFLLGRQMGTSVEMIDKYYGQTVNAEMAAQISKGSQKASKGKKAYPFD